MALDLAARWEIVIWPLEPKTENWDARQVRTQVKRAPKPQNPSLLI
jgi:hypothetical protein